MPLSKWGTYFISTFWHRYSLAAFEPVGGQASLLLRRKTFLLLLRKATQATTLWCLTPWMVHQISMLLCQQDQSLVFTNQMKSVWQTLATLPLWASISLGGHLLSVLLVWKLLTGETAFWNLPLYTHSVQFFFVWQLQNCLVKSWCRSIQNWKGDLVVITGDSTLKLLWFPHCFKAGTDQSNKSRHKV